MMELSASQRADTFKLLDRYSRERHQYFLTEMFLDESTTEYVLCFRPLNATIDSPNRYDCSYLRIGLAAAGTASDTNYLDETLTKLLDSKLEQLNNLSGESH